jgi:2'-5' RNA ligase
MRLFVAVRLADSVVDAALDAAREMRERIGPQLAARWAERDHMHLTVRFIGGVADELVTPLLHALRAPLPVAPFDIALGDCGMFPPSGPPRVIWIGLASGLPSLRRMHEEFNRRLAPLGFAPEDRPFNAHITLARVKDEPRGSSRTIRDVVVNVSPRPARCHITSATLFQSQLSPQGANYRSLLDVPLVPP